MSCPPVGPNEPIPPACRDCEAIGFVIFIVVPIAMPLLGYLYALLRGV
jgi:hypothetical protein